MNADLHERTRGPRWTLAVVCLVALFWLVPGRRGFADGIDDVPKCLAEAQSFRLRGWHWIYLFHKQQVRIRAPIEILVKRPGTFRYSTTFVTSFGEIPTDTSQFVDQCDGSREWIRYDNKLTYSSVMSPLDALLSTKTIEQEVAESMVLGPPDAAYRKVGAENQNGRRLDRYEAQFKTETGPTLARVWIDPKNGMPVRVVHEKLDAQGKTSPEMELTEIAVNIPLADELFRFDGAKQTQTWQDWIRRSVGFEEPEQAPPPAAPTPAAEQQATTARPLLNFNATRIFLSSGVRLDFWYALRISDNAALVLWRRSAPAAQTDTVPDWLSNLTMVVPDSGGDRSLRHQWIYQSLAEDRWNWSLVVTADRKSFGRGQIRFRLGSPDSVVSLETIPLRLREDDLRQLLRAAHDAMLPKSLPEISLPYLQAVARKLSSTASAD
jgi:outer membrane lipoprotein-sorting protein